MDVRQASQVRDASAWGLEKGLTGYGAPAWGLETEMGITKNKNP
jgi:hypothetical protein